MELFKDKRDTRKTGEESTVYRARSDLRQRPLQLAAGKVCPAGNVECGPEQAVCQSMARRPRSKREIAWPFQKSRANAVAGLC